MAGKLSSIGRPVPQAKRGGRRGRYVVFTGPDGTGKSSVADGLSATVGRFRPVRRFHHRLRILPATRQSLQVTTDPHGQSRYSAWVSRAKVLYLFLDELVGWMVRVRGFVGDGGWVVVERGWWDLVVDPHRYRLSAGGTLAAWLGRFLPKPDHLVVLDAPVVIISRRKSELPIAELERQLGRWRELAAVLPEAVIVNAAEPLSQVLEAVTRACGFEPRQDDDIGDVGLWMTIPLGNARWLIPSKSAELARSGLRIYQPMTWRGRIGWEAARVMARAPLIRALAKTQALEPIATLRDLVPSDGGVAVFRGNVPGRLLLLILDAKGRELAFAKIADDDVGIAKLAVEAANLARLGPLLRSPLSSPKILVAEDGLLVTEPVAWLPRARPWRLHIELARAIGRFNGEVRTGSVDHPGHGDFAPWNVMRTHDGWSLIDWESAKPKAQPFADPFHYLVQAHTLLGRPSRRELVEGVAGAGWVGQSLDAYADAAGFASIDRREAMIDYLKESAEAIDFSQSTAEHSRDAREQLLRAMSKDVAHSLSRRQPEAVPTGWHHRLAVVGRAGWGMADQALSSLTNFVLAVIVARSVSTAEFGAFTLAFGVYVICLTLSRAVATDALIMRHSATNPADWRDATASATGTAVTFGVAASLVSLGAGLVVGGVVGGALVVFALGVVPLLLQDAWRFGFFAAKRGRAAFLNDCVWLACLVIGLAAATMVSQPSVTLFIGVWAAAAGVAAAFGVLQARVVPRPDRAFGWWRQHRDLAPRLAMEGVILSASHYVTLLAVTVVAGLAAVGAFRAGEVLMNGLHVATFGIQLFAVPEAVHINRASPRRMVRFCLLVGTTLALAAMSWGSLLLLMPDWIGRALLGQTWETARSVILPMSIVTAAVGVQISAQIGLRALALTHRSLRARIVSSGLSLVGGVVGALLAGAQGTAWGIAVALVIGGAVWWFQLLRAIVPNVEGGTIRDDVGDKPWNTSEL